MSRGASHYWRATGVLAAEQLVAAFRERDYPPGGEWSRAIHVHAHAWGLECSPACRELVSELEAPGELVRDTGTGGGLL